LDHTPWGVKLVLENPHHRTVALAFWLYAFLIKGSGFPQSLFLTI
jgi:hypothetical protein